MPISRISQDITLAARYMQPILGEGLVEIFKEKKMVYFCKKRTADEARLKFKDKIDNIFYRKHHNFVQEVKEKFLPNPRPPSTENKKHDGSNSGSFEEEYEMEFFGFRLD